MNKYNVIADEQIWYNQEEKFRAVAEHWFKYRDHGPDYNDINIIQTQSR